MPYADPEQDRLAKHARYLRDRSRYLARARARAENDPAGVQAAKKRWTERNRLARRAHSAVANALRAGKLQKGTTCAHGPEGCRGRLEAHHEDYMKPLEVTWLCVVHHAALRRLQRQRKTA